VQARIHNHLATVLSISATLFHTLCHYWSSHYHKNLHKIW